MKSDSFGSSGAYTMKPSALPASSTGQWRACCGSSGRVGSRRGLRPTPGRLELGNRRTSMAVCYAEDIWKAVGNSTTAEGKYHLASRCPMRKTPKIEILPLLLLAAVGAVSAQI